MLSLPPLNGGDIADITLNEAQEYGYQIDIQFLWLQGEQRDVFS